jgi:hypothetical protein
MFIYFYVLKIFLNKSEIIFLFEINIFLIFLHHGANIKNNFLKIKNIILKLF